LDPDPKLCGKWDPDPKKIVTDPQHFYIGWVDIGTSTWVPLECIHFYVKTPKTAIKIVLVKW
jgi:hypothetical protein